MTLAEIALALVVGCVGEIGYPQDARECLIEWHIQAAKVGYRPEATAKQVKRYNTVWKRKGRGWLIETPHARAARSVTLDCERPKGLRRKLAWRDLTRKHILSTDPEHAGDGAQHQQHDHCH